jgi:hypothetical protein
MFSEPGRTRSISIQWPHWTEYCWVIQILQRCDHNWYYPCVSCHHLIFTVWLSAGGWIVHVSDDEQCRHWSASWAVPLLICCLNLCPAPHFTSLVFHRPKKLHVCQWLVCTIIKNSFPTYLIFFTFSSGQIAICWAFYFMSALCDDVRIKQELAFITTC